MNDGHVHLIARRSGGATNFLYHCRCGARQRVTVDCHGISAHSNWVGGGSDPPPNTTRTLGDLQ